MCGQENSRSGRSWLWPPRARGHNACYFEELSLSLVKLDVQDVHALDLDFWLLLSSQQFAPRGLNSQVRAQVSAALGRCPPASACLPYSVPRGALEAIKLVADGQARCSLHRHTHELMSCISAVFLAVQSDSPVCISKDCAQAL